MCYSMAGCTIRGLFNLAFIHYSPSVIMSWSTMGIRFSSSQTIWRMPFLCPSMYPAYIQWVIMPCWLKAYKKYICALLWLLCLPGPDVLKAKDEYTKDFDLAFLDTKMTTGYSLRTDIAKWTAGSHLGDWADSLVAPWFSDGSHCRGSLSIWIIKGEKKKQ